jgi:hypothetical protein
VPRYPPAADAPLALARDDFHAKRSEAAISVGAIDPGASVMNASESGPLHKRGTLSHGGDPADDPKTGKRRLPGQARLPDITPLPGARHPP